MTPLPLHAVCVDSRQTRAFAPPTGAAAPAAAGEVEAELAASDDSRESQQTPASKGAARPRLTTGSSTCRLQHLLTQERLPWFVDPRVRWRHPVPRIAVTLVVMALDFFIYGEDPVQASRVEYVFPVMGHIYGLLILWPSGVGEVLLRLVLIILSLVLGIYVGRQWLHHRFLRNCCRLSMFDGDKGVWFVELIVLPFALYAAAIVNNLLVTGTVNAPLSARTYRPYYQWGRVWQYISAFLDVASIVQVVDVVLQDRQVYPDWAVWAKRVWNDEYNGWVRVVAVWVVSPLALAGVYTAIANTGLDKGDIRWDSRVFGGFGAFGRTLVVSVITICDVLNVAQDWEFPTFDRPLEIMVVGTFQQELSFPCLDRLIERLRQTCVTMPPGFWRLFHITITGGWLMYGPLLGSLMADLSCGNGQFRYDPADYGQYVHNGTRRVWVIRDTSLLERAYRDGTLVRPELVTFAARQDPADAFFDSASSATDVELNSVRGPLDSMAWAALLPGVFAIAVFTFLVWGGERYWRSHAMERLGLAGEKWVRFLDRLLARARSRLSAVAGTRSRGRRPELPAAISAAR